MRPASDGPTPGRPINSVRVAVLRSRRVSSAGASGDFATPAGLSSLFAGGLFFVCLAGFFFAGFFFASRAGFASKRRLFASYLIKPARDLGDRRVVVNKARQAPHMPRLCFRQKSRSCCVFFLAIGLGGCCRGDFCGDSLLAL